MSEWSSRPRVIPWAGRRKGTARFCLPCDAWHPLHRAVGGEAPCAHQQAARAERRDALAAGPHIRQIPRTASH